MSAPVPPSGPLSPPPPPLSPAPPPLLEPTPSPEPLGPSAAPGGAGRGRRRSRLLSTLVLLGLVAAASGTTLAVQAYRATGTPEAVVSGYFADLARGDAAAALATGPVPAGDRTLLRPEVLRAARDVVSIQDVSVGPAAVRGTTAVVPVRYRLGGDGSGPVSDAVPLTRGRDGWRLTRSALAVTISVLQAASWAAVTAPHPFAVPSGTVLVFPGAVPVVFRSTAVQPVPGSRTVRFASPDATVSVRAQVSPTGAAAAAGAVRSALAACARGGPAADPFCPQPPPGVVDGVALRSVPQSFRGRLTGPVRSLTEDVADSGGTIAVTGEVDVQGSWQVLDYDDVAVPRSGRATVTFGATVPIAAPGSAAWERG